MARVKVKLADNILRVVSIDPAATNGATIGTNFHLPDGSVPTLAELQVLFAANNTGGIVHHRLLQGLRLGDDHPQYTQWVQDETITGQWQWSQSLWGPDGTAALPAFTFTSDVDTGIYRVGANNLGVSTNGVLRWDISTTAITSTLPRLGQDGAVGAPAYSFSGDANTGIYRIGADSVGIAAGGVLQLSLSSTGGASTRPFAWSGVHTWNSNGFTEYAIDVYRDDGLLQPNISATGVNINGGGTFHVRHARGTYAAPTPSQAGDITGGIGSRVCYTAGTYQSSSPAAIHWVVTETQSPSAFGMWMRFLTTPQGSTTRREVGGFTDTQTIWGHDNGTYNALSSAQTRPVSDARFVASADNSSGSLGSSFLAVVYGGSSNCTPGFRGAGARGTPAAPAVPQLNDYLCYMGGHGFDGSAFTTGTKALIGFRAAEVFSSTTQGTYITFETTIVGGTTRSEIARISNASGYSSTYPINLAPASAATPAIYINTAAAGQVGLHITGNATSGNSFGARIDAGTTSADYALNVQGQTGATPYFRVRGDGRSYFHDGSVALPSMAFINDTDCGIYRIGANNLGLGVGGANVIDINATRVLFAAPPRAPSYTVVGLPAAATVGIGSLAVVTDNTLTAVTGQGVAPVGGGANATMVFSTGAAWLGI